MNSIKVYGSGCANCVKLAGLCNDAVNELSLDFTIEKVTDMKAIVERGILQTPALEINGKIIATGKIPTKATLIHWIEESVKS